MDKIKGIFLRAHCFVLSCFGSGHDYEQIYDETSSRALACRRCGNIDNVELFKEGQFGDEPPPALQEIHYHGLGRPIENRKVESVASIVKEFLLPH